MILLEISILDNEMLEDVLRWLDNIGKLLIYILSYYIHIVVHGSDEVNRSVSGVLRVDVYVLAC